MRRAPLPTEALVFPAVGFNLTALRSPSAVPTVFHKFAKRRGFEVRFHDLRASHETILLDAGVPVHVVAKRCGHEALMWLKIYARRTRKAGVAATNVIETLAAGVLGPSCGQAGTEDATTD